MGEPTADKSPIGLNLGSRFTVLSVHVQSPLLDMDAVIGPLRAGTLRPSFLHQRIVIL